MSKDKKPSSADANLESIESSLGKAEQFVEKNQKKLMNILLIIAVIVGGYFGVQKFYIQPKEKDAQAQMRFAENWFDKKEYKLAIEGDGNNLGFLDIIEEYSITKSANLANYYAGISYLKLKKYEKAIDYLKSFSSNDFSIKNTALCSIGDAYVELGKNKEAVSYYMDAASSNENEITTPIYLMKAGATYERIKDFKSALDVYETIETKFPNSRQANNIEKYITRAKLSK